MKQKLFSLFLLLATGFLPLAPALAETAPQVAASDLAAHLPNLMTPSASLLTSGQPDASAWALLKQQGVTTVVSLRSDQEMEGSDEPAQVAAHGMKYVHIPVAGAPAVTLTNAARLHDVLAQAQGKVLVHCASGNRAGALLAIDAAQSRHLGVEDAITYGKSAGLTSLELRVREVLSAPQIAEPAVKPQ